jgi:CheY-like chemotaxis protein
MAHVMVVEDEKDVVTLLKFLLEKDGHSVTEASNGQEAIVKLGLDGGPNPEASVALPELILLDVMMPIMDGYSVCARLHESELTRAIPIIILTAKGEMRELFERVNVAAYVNKPFDIQKLRQVITQVLARRKK